MYIVEVIPLIKSSGIETLTYYSSEQHEIGTILLVPIRKSDVSGVVVSVKPVSAAKTALKAATFSLRKLTVSKDTAALPTSLIETVKELAREYPANLGAILFSLLPPDIRTGKRLYPQSSPIKFEADSAPYVLTDTSQERYMIYRSRVRETFAKKGSTLIIVPTASRVAIIAEALEQGIASRIITFSSTHTKRQLDTSYKALSDKSESKLIIVTPSYAFLERSDLMSIIIDQAGSPYYRSRIKPYIDYRQAVKKYAKITGRGLLLGDLIVSTEDEVKRREDIYQTLDEHVSRIHFPSGFSLIQKPDSSTPEKKFKIFLPETQDAIARTVEARGKVFLYAARRGLAPIIMCYDCGHILRCPDSGTPFALFRTYLEDGTERRWFISRTSGKKIRASDTCPACGSWRLREQGFGIQQVVEEAKENFPSSQVITFDSSSATTHKKAMALANEFIGTKGVIMVGTAMSLPYLPAQIDLSVITSYEAIRSLTTWRADETILSLINTLREHTAKDLIIQTRSDADQLLKYAAKGQVDTFYNDEIALREALGYPPYATFILLTMTGSKTEVQQYESQIDAILTDNEVQYYNAPHSMPEKTVRYGLLRIKKADWPNDDLVNRLRALPPYIKIEIDPDRIV